MRYRIPITVHLIFVRQGRLLMLRRANTGYMDGYYSLPAGHLDGGEPVRTAGCREALEEVGLRIVPEGLAFAGVIHRCEDSERVDFFFQVQDWSGEPANAEPDKCDDLLWADPTELPANTVPYVRRAIENWAAGVRFEEFGWAVTQP